MRVVLKTYPNNEIRLAVLFDQGVRDDLSAAKCDSSCDSSESEGDPTDSGHYLDITSKVETKRTQTIDGLSPGFGLPPRPKAFSCYGKRSLLRAGGAIEKAGIPPEHCVFLTGTLPGGTSEAMAAIANWSGYLVHRLKAWIGKRCTNKLDLYVWEYQSRGALHLHYMAVIPDEVDRTHVLSGFKDEWVRLLDTVGSRSGCNMFLSASGIDHRLNLSNVQAYAQEVYANCASYLAKYCSKSAGKPQGGENYPVSFWGVSRPLKALIARFSTVSEIVKINLANARERFREMLQEMTSYAKQTYRYGRDYGLGMFAVAYTNSNEFDSVRESLEQMLNGVESGMQGKNTNMRIAQQRFIRDYVAVLQDNKLRGVLDSNLAPASKAVLTQAHLGSTVAPFPFWEALDDVIQCCAEYSRARRLLYARLRSLIISACNLRQHLENCEAVACVVREYPGLATRDGTPAVIFNSIDP